MSGLARAEVLDPIMSATCRGPSTPTSIASMASVIRGLDQDLSKQRQVVKEQEENVRFWQEADTLLDVERASDVVIRDEVDQLANAKSVQLDLEAKIDQAIKEWSEFGLQELHGQPWTLGSSTTTSQSEPHEQLVESLRVMAMIDESPDLAAHDIRNPEVGKQARGISEWNKWVQAPTATPADIAPPVSPWSEPPHDWWWIHEQDHYGLLNSAEQSQLESSARAATNNRVVTSGLAATRQQPMLPPPELLAMQSTCQAEPTLIEDDFENGESDRDMSDEDGIESDIDMETDEGDNDGVDYMYATPACMATVYSPMSDLTSPASTWYESASEPESEVEDAMDLDSADSEPGEFDSEAETASNYAPTPYSDVSTP